jgi:hypothetical protein
MTSYLLFASGRHHMIAREVNRRMAGRMRLELAAGFRPVRLRERPWRREKTVADGPHAPIVSWT